MSFMKLNFLIVLLKVNPACNDVVLDELLNLLGLEYHRYLTPQDLVIQSHDFIARCVSQTSIAQFCHLFRMDPNAFENILKLITNHEQFHNNSNAPQAPILLQLMVALYRFGRRIVMVHDVSNQFGKSEGVIYLFICQVILALCSLGANIIKWPTLEEK